MFVYSGGAPKYACSPRLKHETPAGRVYALQLEPSKRISENLTVSLVVAGLWRGTVRTHGPFAPLDPP